jgi:hypothetical protein
VCDFALRTSFFFEKILLTTLIDSRPLILITEIAPIPGGVANATIVSSKLEFIIIFE